MSNFFERIKITKVMKLEEARVTAEEHISGKEYYSISDIPTVANIIQEHIKTNNSNVMMYINHSNIFSTSSEVLTVINGKEHYQVWHSAGPLATLSGLERTITYLKENIPIKKFLDLEEAFQNKSYEGENFDIVGLQDLQNGYEPGIGERYVVSAKIDLISSNDMMLMRAGSKKRRTAVVLNNMYNITSTQKIINRLSPRKKISSTIRQLALNRGKIVSLDLTKMHLGKYIAASVNC